MTRLSQLVFLFLIQQKKLEEAILVLQLSQVVVFLEEAVSTNLYFVTFSYDVNSKFDSASK